MIITAVEYVRPDGRRREVQAEMPDDLQDNWDLIGELEVELTLEAIPGGQVSICLDQPEIGDFRHELVPNGPEVMATVERVIREFDRGAFEDWRRAAEVYDSWREGE